MRQLLATSLAARIGATLTAEEAKAIMREVLNAADFTIDPAQFPPERHGRYTIQCERIEAVLPELQHHHAAYHAEVYPDGPPLDYDYPRLIDKARAGEALLATVRTADAVVGHLLIFINSRIDTRTLVAQDDRFWLAPEHRGGALAIRLWRFTQAAIIRLGISEGWVDSRADNGAGRMAAFMGWKPISTKYSLTVAQDACSPNVPTRHSRMDHGTLAQD